MRKLWIMTVVFSVTVMSVMGFALWIAGLTASGTVVSASGIEPSAITYENLDLNITDIEDSVVFYYTNEDGVVNMNFTLSENLSSTDSTCNYEVGKDILFSIEVNSNGFYPMPYVTQVNTGSNAIELKAVGDINRCPSYGSYVLTARLV